MSRFGRAAIGLLATLAVLGFGVPILVPQSSMGQGMTGDGMMGHGMGGYGMAGRSGQGMGGGYGSMPRHRFAMMSGIPAPYASLRNPLPRTSTTIAHGATVYAQSCAACHGPSGAGNGDAARTLSPPPANLAWLAQMPMARWDPFMYWAIAEGGAQFGSAMPAFKDALATDDIWSVIAYIQAGCPATIRRAAAAAPTIRRR